MSDRSDVPPETLPVDLQDGGIEVTYADDRAVFYHGVPDRVENRVRTAPGKDVHVLVTDGSGTRGVLVYVNDRLTHDDILESTGVGRVLLKDGEETTVFPGVRARAEGYRVTVEADPGVDGRVFVFEEDEMGERSFEVVPTTGDGDRTTEESA